MPPPTTPLVVLRDPVARFLLTVALLYLAWHLLYRLVLAPAGTLDILVIDNLAWASGGLLQLLGYELLPDPGFDHNRYLGIQGGHHLWIGNACNGLSVFAVFLIFLLAYPGDRRHLWWFAPLGLLLIHTVNVLRIAALCIVAAINYEWLNFNHDYTFQVLVYGVVVLLWLWWGLRLGRAPATAPAP